MRTSYFKWWVSCQATSVSQRLLRDEFLQTRPQLNLNAIMSVSAVIHQHEVSVIDIETGEMTLTLLVQSVVRRETTLEEITENSVVRLLNELLNILAHMFCYEIIWPLDGRVRVGCEWLPRVPHRWRRSVPPSNRCWVCNLARPCPRASSHRRESLLSGSTHLPHGQHCRLV